MPRPADSGGDNIPSMRIFHLRQFRSTATAIRSRSVRPAIAAATARNSSPVIGGESGSVSVGPLRYRRRSNPSTAAHAPTLARISVHKSNAP